MSIQREIINVLITELNKDGFKFQEGYLFFQEMRDANQNQLFSFIVNDENNNFGIVEKKYVPTSFGSFIGKVAPIKEIYDEESTIDVQFAIPIDGDYLDRLKDVEEFKKDLRKFTGSFDTEDMTLNYSISTSPIDQDQSPAILNGKNIVRLSLTVFYRVSEGRFGNSNSYLMETLNDEGLPKVKLLQIGSNGSINNGLDSSQKTNTIEVQSTIGSSGWGKNTSFYDYDITVDENDLEVANWFVDRLGDAYVNGANKLQDIYKININASGKSGVRNVYVENITYHDPDGAVITWSCNFRIASDDDVAEQTV